MTIAKEVQSE
jgi:hypothetical protein